MDSDSVGFSTYSSIIFAKLNKNRPARELHSKICEEGVLGREGVASIW